MKKRPNPPPVAAKKPPAPPNPAPVRDPIAEHIAQSPFGDAPPSEPVAPADQQKTIDYLRHQLSILQQEREADAARLRAESEKAVKLQTKLYAHAKAIQQIGQAEGQVVGAKVQAIERALSLVK